MAKKKTAKKIKRAVKRPAKKTAYWANIYRVDGHIVVQGNTSTTKAEAVSNAHPGWQLIATNVVFEE